MGSRRRLWLVLAVVVVATGLAVPAASASRAEGLLLPSCGATSKPFTLWGDSASYCAFPNLGFESGKTAWTLTGGASIASANEPWHVSGSGTHALQLGPGATATSSSLPVSLLDPWIRLFAHSVGANGSLRVQVVFHGLLGNLTGLLNVGSLSPSGYSSWQPTQRILSTLALPLATTSAQVVLTSQAKLGSWQLDDVYLDPCKLKLG
ncbi:MAG TPA: hypothetical protein VHZ77_04840 [Gaiellaceae bacterium]|nr:hypothetical protein [Gaiellaceae bacterium]